MQSLQFTVILGSGYGNILQLFFPCNSFPFRPPPHLPFWFPYHLFGTCQFYLAQFLLGRTMFMLAGVLRVLYTELFYSSHLSFSSSSPHSLFLWTSSLLDEIFPLVSLCPSFIIFSLCTSPHSNERQHTVFKAVCLIYFTQRYIFQVHPFSYKCLKFSFFIAM